MYGRPVRSGQHLHLEAGNGLLALALLLPR
jgi:hypothetical protein